MSQSAVISERVICFQPALAKLVGINAAIVIQQVQFLLSLPRSGREIDGHKWIYNTYEDWQKDHFQFWSRRTIERAFSELEKRGIVVSCQPDGKMSRKKYYRLNQGMMAKLTIEAANLIDPEHDNLASSEHAKLAVWDDDNLASSVTDTTTENTTEIRDEFVTQHQKEKRGRNQKSKAVIPAALDCDRFRAAWSEYEAYRREQGYKALKDTSIQTQWNRMAIWGLDEAVDSIQRTIAQGYQGLFPSGNLKNPVRYTGGF